MKNKKAIFVAVVTAVLVVLLIVLYLLNITPEKSDAIRIFCYGDSNTYGYDPNTLGGRYDEDKIWPSIMQKELGNDYKVINCGKSGMTTAFDGSLKYPELNGLKQVSGRLEENYPIDVAIIMLGANDCNVGMNLSAYDITKGMEALVRKVRTECMENQGYEPVIIIATPQAYTENYENSPLSYQMDKNSYNISHSLAEPFSELAKEMNCLFFDASTNYEVSDFDSQHLTLKGHEELGKDMADVIKTIDFEKTLQN